MRAILASLGTDGDVLPFIGIGTELRARGHRVTLVAAENYADLAAAHHLEFSELVSAARMRELLGNPDFWHPLKTARFTAKWGASLIEPQYHVLKSLVGAGDEVFVTNPAIFAATLLHESQKIPLAHVVLQPWFIPSAIAPPLMPLVGVPASAPAIFHRLFFRCMDVAADWLVGPTLNPLRRSLGLKPARRILSNIFSRQLVIGMFPDWYGPPQADWPKQVKLVGFPRFDGAVKRTLPPDVLEFVTKKYPTILFTFGSGMMHTRQLFEASAKVCAELGVQGLFVNRFIDPAASAPNMLKAPFLPFSEIFPHCAAVVHHGGVGTTAEALAAASPQLILPLGFDQLDNGARVKKLGVGSHTRSKHGFLSPRGLIASRDLREIVETLRKVLQPEVKKRCGEMASRLQSVRPLEEAARLIEALSRFQAVV